MLKKLDKSKAEVVENNQTQVVKNKYTSESYRLSFFYPDGTYVKEEAPDKIEVLDKETKSKVAEVVVVLEEGDVEVPYEQFVLDETRGLCQKEAENLSCSEVRNLSSYINESGLKAQEFYLVLSEEIGGSVYQKEKGPFFTFNFSGSTLGKMSFVLVRPPLTNRGSVDVIDFVSQTLSF